MDPFWHKRHENWDLDSDAVVEAEKVNIARARYAEDLNSDDPLTAVALSGGGIRSAAFAMGVLQAMVRYDCLQRVDYLSTVSGGGYIGSSLSWWLSRGYGTRAGNFPLGARPGTSSKREFADNNLNYIRQHAEYLTPGKGLNAMSLVGVVFRSLFSALLAYLPLMTIMLGLVFTVIPRVWSAFGWPGTLTPAFPFWVVGILLYLLILGAIIYSLFTGSAVSQSIKYRFSVWTQRQLGHSWTFIAILLVLGTLPFVHGTIKNAVDWTGQLSAGGSGWAAIFERIGAVIAGVGTALTVALRALHALDFKVDEQKGWKKGIVRALAAVVVYALLLAAYAINDILARRFPSVEDMAALYGWGLAFIVLIYAIHINLNQVGHHRMYRDRLMELFMADDASVEKNLWARATEANEALLHNYSLVVDKDAPKDKDASHFRRPYQIINTNVVLVDSANPRYRGRGGDSFVLSPMFVGSDATRWCHTFDFRVDGNRRMTLPTAMAISGAAVNPNTGASGRGPTRDRLVSALMTLLNIRLGYWIRGPFGFSIASEPPNYIVPGLYSLLGFGYQEQAQYLEITDGGHFDNLGLYELIRRRVKTIILSDAACDPDFKFSDLASVIERVRTDFGAIVEFSEAIDESLGGLVPSRDGVSHETAEIRLADRGHAVATIRYSKHPSDPENTPGRLIYIKSTLIDGLPLDVYDYKRRTPAFPDETTADQFFDERQFEAYRELGYYIGKDAVVACWPEAKAEPE